MSLMKIISIWNLDLSGPDPLLIPGNDAVYRSLISNRGDTSPFNG